MSYGTAQRILDDEIKDEELNLGNISAADRPRMCEKVKKSVRDLNAIALILRKKRFDSGCVRLQRGKLGFRFPRVTDESGL